MIARTVLLLLLPIIAAVALTRRRRLACVIGMGLFSLVLAATYLLLHAPDVAITEAAIGAALVTVIYVLAIRRTGRLIVVGDEAPGLLALEGGHVVGLEAEILAGFARRLGLDLSVQLVSRRQVEATLMQGDADLGAGGLVDSADRAFPSTKGHMPTALVRIHHRGAPQPAGEAPQAAECDYPGYFSDLIDTIQRKQPLAATLDMARFLVVSRHDLSSWTIERLAESRSYVFVAAPRRAALCAQLDAYVEELSSTGALDDMIRRHVA